MCGLNIELFGEFRVWRGDDPIENGEWGRQKTRPLLKLLLTRPGRAFSRDEIMDALWPDASPKAADRSLRATVSLLRRVLESDLERGPDSKYILRQRSGYAFDHQADCWVDAWEFEGHRKRAEAARRTGDLDKAVGEYRAALDLMGGEFLAEDLYEEWAVEVRQEWQKRYLDVLSKLAECLAQKGRYTEAMETCNRALAVDEYSENLHRQLMLYHYCAGEQALALQTYRGYAAKLAEELGTAPSTELARLKERIRARDVPGVDERRRYPRPHRPLRFPYSLSRTHFVGREKELSLLVEWLGEVEEGRGGAVAVEGEAGVGKTRLAEEFLGYARSLGARVLSGRCYERDLGAFLEPVADALDPLIDADDVLAAIANSGPSGSPWENIRRESNRVYRKLTGELIRQSHSADHDCLILFVDDVQWADTATLEFLSYLSRRVAEERVLLLFAYRREDAPALTQWLHRLAEIRAIKATLALERLSREDLSRILERMSVRNFGELTLLAGFLHRESEGNPFYAVEYLRWLIEAGAVRIDARRRICALEGAALEESRLPTGVQSLLEVRLASLDDGTRDLLELAAVVGRSFDLVLLCRAAACGEAEAFGFMKPAMASGLVVETIEETYYFSHDKLRQGLYAGIDAPRRRKLHLRVARALEDTGGESAELAHHYLRAKEWQPALENLVLAAKKAEESYAWEHALEHYARALEVAEKLPGSEERRFELLAARDRLLEHMERREERAEAVREMFELAQGLGDRYRIAGVYVRRIGTLAAISDLKGAEETAREAVAIFRELDDLAGEAWTHRELGYVYWMNQYYTRALEESFKSLQVHRELGDRRGEAGDALNLSQVYRAMGRHEQALRWAEEAARIYEELSDKRGEDLRTYIMTAVLLDRGELEAALDLSLKALKLNEELGTSHLVATSHSRCGTLYLRLGRPGKALEHFRAAARLNRELGYARDEGYSLMSVGLALEQAGDPDGAARAYRRAVELLEATHQESGMREDLSGHADALGLLANVLHRSLDRPEDALEAYEKAARIYRDFGDVRNLRKVLLRLAGLHWRLGDLENSARGYEEVLSLTREAGKRAQEATALMSLSVVYRDLARLRESLRCGKAARELLRDVEDIQGEAYALTSLAESYEELGHHKSALSCLKRSLRLRRKLGDKEGKIKVLRYLAEVYETLGDTNRAEQALEEATREEEAL